MNALKIVCPDLERIMRSFTVMVQRGRDQLVDIVLIGWWLGKWESASSTFRFQLAWGLCASGQYTILNFSHLEGISVSVKQLKDIACVSTDGEMTVPQSCTIVSLDYFSLVFHPLTSLTGNSLNLLLELREGPRDWMKAIFCKQKGFVPRNPTEPYLVSIVLLQW